MELYRWTVTVSTAGFSRRIPVVTGVKNENVAIRKAIARCPIVANDPITYTVEDRDDES